MNNLHSFTTVFFKDGSYSVEVYPDTFDRCQTCCEWVRECPHDHNGDQLLCDEGCPANREPVKGQSVTREEAIDWWSQQTAILEED